MLENPLHGFADWLRDLPLVIPGTVMRTTTSVLGIVLFGFAGALAQPADGPVIARFTGNGDTNTRPFETNGPWEIHWHGDLSIYMRQIDAKGDLIDTGHASGKDGSSFFPKAGRYFLAILPTHGTDTWSVTVIPFRP
jgi:hypothetical protein